MSVPRPSADWRPYLSESLRASVLAETLEAMRRIGSESERAGVLADLLPHLPEPLLGQALGVARGIGDQNLRAKALSCFAGFVELPRQMLHFRWSGLVAAAMLGSRYEMLQVLVPSAPVIAGMGGTEALVEVAHAVGDVGRWWP